jgi:multidrug transporter EmrE-like cation transporter
MNAMRDDGRARWPRAIFRQSATAYIFAGRRKTKGFPMSSTKIIAIVLIVAGVLGLAYGKFTYTKETHDAKIGPVELSVKDKETVNIPMWAGIGAIVVGAGLLLAGGKRA